SATREELPADAVQTEWSTGEAATAQPEWATTEALAPEAAQAEWSSSPESAAIAQPEWSATTEELPADAVQAEWSSTTEQPATPEWGAPAPQAESAWNTAEAAPVELQPEWVSAEPEPTAEWSEQQPAPQTEWSASSDSATATWDSEPTETPPQQSEWSEAPVDVEPMVEAEPVQAEDVSWSEESPAPPSAPWQAQDSQPFGAPVTDFSTAEPEFDTSLAPLETEEVPAELEQEQELAEIELVEEAVEPPEVNPLLAATAMAAAVMSAALRLPDPAARPSSHAATALPSARAPLATPPVAERPQSLAASREPLFAVVPPMHTDSITSFIEGEHRVIIHTVEGQVKRGTIRDADLLDEVISLEQQSGYAPEQIPGKRVKAIFFMLAAGARQPQAEGQKIRVTFNDGRQVAGFSQDFKGTTPGFFVVPADQRTNTARIFIYRSSVQAVAEG
uniref:DUF6982 domain-containing protein n=1 Tax=Myxococcus eversor TaxID=2709661 RepID=UPI003B8326E0